MQSNNNDEYDSHPDNDSDEEDDIDDDNDPGKWMDDE